ncbi:CBS domain-containing protein [Cupriavidus sp. H18C1]|uniref:CBS domain-containing protein n=1 Tax=Cupriavidus sp. H18C1 TaxID=3241601 RepID=UPI003BB9015D
MRARIRHAAQEPYRRVAPPRPACHGGVIRAGVLERILRNRGCVRSARSANYPQGETTMATEMQGGAQRSGGVLRDVMTAQPAFLTQDDTIKRAAELMAQLDVGALPVCDGRRLTGMVTDRDITVRCTAAGADPANTKVTQAMTEDVQWCSDDESIDTAREKMAAHQIRRLAVIDKDHHLVGMVSLGDLAVKTGDTGGTGEALQGVSQPAQPSR